MKLIDELVKILGMTKSTIGTKLKVNPTRISQLNTADQLTSKQVLRLASIAFSKGKVQGVAKVNSRIINDLKMITGKGTDQSLASETGIDSVKIRNMKQGLVEFDIEAVKKYFQAKIARDEKFAVETIVEYFPVEVFMNKSDNWFFRKRDGDKSFEAVTQTMKARSGIYAFHDSQGQTIYIGKANATKFHTEIESALKRNFRTEIMLGDGEKLKSAPKKILMAQATRYFSCWAITPESAIDAVEALMIRASYNNIRNDKFQALPKD